MEEDKKNLIEKDDFLKATQLDKLPARHLAKVLMKIMKLPQINELYQKSSLHEGIEFLNYLVELLQVSPKVSEDDLQKIPTDGNFVCVSNHPFGVLDGILLMQMLIARRPDFKVMGNFLLKKIPPLSPYVIPVNPMETHKDAYSSLAGMKEALQHLRDGHPLGIFPAGEVSTYQPDSRKILDRQWQIPAIKLIKRAKAPIVPVYFHGTNSKIFHLLGRIHPLLRTATLSRELFKKQGEEISMRIGNPISVKTQDEFEGVERFGRYLRAKTYALGSGFSEVKKYFYPSLSFPSKPKQIVASSSSEAIKNEIEALKKNHNVLYSHQQYECYVAESHHIPNILHQIGRLREITFREVGEGTNKSIDIDEFDLYYHHLFLWDTKEEKIAGAYRVGKGKEIISKMGKKGFYIQTLFKTKKNFAPYLEQSLELGRSFIPKEYQQKRLTLFLLWKGILYFLIKNTHYKYLIGPVSISSTYTEVSRSLIVKFIQENFYDHSLAELVSPRRKYRLQLDLIDTDVLLDQNKNHSSLSNLDKLLQDIEPKKFSAPILLKKYIQQNAKIIAFNLDPKFNNALDGLMILDIDKVPQETIDNLKREMNPISP